MKIAICGGIASGKSTVTQILIKAGAVVLSADEINKQIISTPEYVEWLLYNLGDEFVLNGMPNKQKIRDAISVNKEIRNKINEYLHPLIRTEINNESKELLKENNVVFIEVPLLMTAGMKEDFESVWYVRADDDIRIRRLMVRNNINEESAFNLLKVQEIEKQAENIADVIIDNNNTYNILCQKVLQEYNAIIK